MLTRDEAIRIVGTLIVLKMADDYVLYMDVIDALLCDCHECAAKVREPYPCEEEDLVRTAYDEYGATFFSAIHPSHADEKVRAVATILSAAMPREVLN